MYITYRPTTTYAAMNANTYVTFVNDYIKSLAFFPKSVITVISPSSKKSNSFPQNSKNNSFLLLRLCIVFTRYSSTCIKTGQFMSLRIIYHCIVTYIQNFVNCIVSIRDYLKCKWCIFEIVSYNKNLRNGPW